MLIQGSPDMLSPPRTPTLSGLGGLSGAAQSDPYWSYRVESVQYLWNGRANPWEKASTLATWAAQWEWTADDFAQAAGVSVEEMRSVLAGPKTLAEWQQLQALGDIADVFASETLKGFQKASMIRSIAEQYSLTLERIATALGIPVADLQSWLYSTDEYYRKPLAHLFAASWLDAARVSAALRDFARGHNLAADDLARLTGKSLDAINRLLTVAASASAPGLNVIAQATPSSPGLVAIAGSDAWAVIPAGSDPVVGAIWSLTIRTTSGFEVQLPQGPTQLRIPINSRGSGAIASVMGNQNLTLADKARAIAAIQAEFGASDEEMQYWGADVGGLSYAQFIAAGTATYAAYTPDQIAFGPRSITNNEDAELWDLFYGIWNDAGLTLEQRIAGVVDAMIANDVGLYDLGRITGFDAVAWQQTLGVDADFMQARAVPVVVAPDLIDANFTVAQTSVFETASPAAQAAQGPNGIGIVAMHQNIRDFIADAGTDYRSVVDAMQTWGVSLDDIKAALFDTPGSAVWIAGLQDFINAPPVVVKTPPTVQVATVVETPVVVDEIPGPVTTVQVATVVETSVVVDEIPGPMTTMPETVPDTITDTTTGAPAMIQLPANLGTMTEAQKIAWYRATLAAGNTDAAIRAAVEATYGRQSDSSWTYLRAKAAQTGGAAGGAGLLIAAAAAYFLLG
jgi:hypothetical protein